MSYEEACRPNEEAKGTGDSCGGAGANRGRSVRKAKTSGVKAGPEGKEMKVAATLGEKNWPELVTK